MYDFYKIFASRNWLFLNFPELLLREVSELVGGDLDIQAENQEDMPVDGWVELSFQLSSGPAISVPLLFFREEISAISVGFDVIFELLKAGDVDLVACMGLDQEKAEKAINIIQSSGSLPLSDVSVCEKKVVISAGQAVKVKSHAPVGLLESATPVLFQPDKMQCWPESLTVNDKLLMLQKGIGKKIPVTVVITSKQDVTLSPNW